MSEIIAVAGGIGAGKSVVCKVLRAMGHDVYDSDMRARAVMDSSEAIKKFLVEEIHAEAVDVGGNIDRQRVASVVFVDESKRLLLNRAVHGAVREDFVQWCERHQSAGRLFIECAILCESGLARYVDTVWLVDAPANVRIKRVCRRNGLTESQVLDRIKAQQAEENALRELPYHTILNDDFHPLLPRIEELLGVE